MPRSYRLGRRQAAVDRTQAGILSATRQLLAERPAQEIGVADVARRAGVSRITVYNRFGSRQALLASVAGSSVPGEAPDAALEPRAALAEALATSCARWSLDPALHRHLSPLTAAGDDVGRALAERLAAADQLRPGCSIKEAADVIGVLASFAVFDRLYKDGRRSTAAVAEILTRLAESILS